MIQDQLTPPGLPSLPDATGNGIALAPTGMVFNGYGQFCAGPAPHTQNETAQAAVSRRRRVRVSRKRLIPHAIPTSGTNKDRFKFIFSRVNSVQSPFKKRIQIRSQSSTILEDEKCDALSAKDTVEQHKKCFMTQSKHTKQFKPQTAFYWKHLMGYLEKADSKTVEGCDALIVKEFGTKLRWKSWTKHVSSCVKRKRMKWCDIEEEKTNKYEHNGMNRIKPK
eukprot:843653_1